MKVRLKWMEQVFFLSLCLFLLFDSVAVSADDDTYDAKWLPAQMEPKTEIYYVYDGQFIIVKGGVSDAGLDSWHSALGNELGVIYEKPPRGLKGMSVTYANDGHIDKVIYDSVDQEKSVLENTESYIGTGVGEYNDKDNDLEGSDLCEVLLKLKSCGQTQNEVLSRMISLLPLKK